ncbi:MAG: hypothetical protein GX629_03100, partial [Phycisphaerae bacterium]|nr:hypothetical protein [Phycisphaerae bacterium]
QSVPNCFTEEAVVSFVTHAAGSGTIGSTWQGFELFVETVAAPEFSPAGPEIDGPTEVTIGCATQNASIYYTTDGTTPATSVTGSTLLYTGPVTINPGTTLSAIAVKTGFNNSAVTCVSYVAPKIPVVSDDFQSETMSDQWTLEALNPTNLHQGWRKVYANLSTNTGPRRAGYKSAANYALKGDFDVRINFEAYASAVGATGDAVSGRLIIASVSDPAKSIDIRNARSYDYLDGTWLMLALINNDHLTRPENLRGYPAVALRAVRTGNTLSAYGRPMQQAPNGLLAPVGDGEWTLILSRANCFTDDATVSFVTYADGNATIGSTWQDFELFVESTAAPMPDFSPAYSVISGPKSITITSSLPNAVIRYTDDESEPTEVNGTVVESGDTVSITTSGTTLKARVWADGLDPSPVRSVTYTFPTSYNRPEVIARDDTIVVDGDLSDWSAADFIPLDTPYDGDGASDVINAYYAAKWNSTGKIYVAVKVTDSSQYLVDECEGWDKSDTVEIYLHTQGTTDKYVASSNWNHNWESAQQYITGLRTDGGSVWTILGGSSSAAPAVAGITAAGSRSGATYIYEYELTPYDSFGGWFGGPSIVSTLSENDVIGLDICVSSTDSEGNFLGMISENDLPEKEEYVSSIGIHRLGPEVTYIPGDANFDNKVDVGDLGILAANYGMTSWATWSKGDFNGDSKVDVGDLGILAANYGTGTSGANFEADYAKVFGTATDEDEVIDTSLCGGLGFPLVAGLLLMGLMLVKLEQ